MTFIDQSHRFNFFDDQLGRAGNATLYIYPCICPNTYNCSFSLKQHLIRTASQPQLLVTICMTNWTAYLHVTRLLCCVSFKEAIIFLNLADNLTCLPHLFLPDFDKQHCLNKKKHFKAMLAYLNSIFWVTQLAHSSNFFIRCTTYRCSTECNLSCLTRSLCWVKLFWHARHRVFHQSVFFDA